MSIPFVTVHFMGLWDARHKQVNSMPERGQNWIIKYSTLFYSLLDARLLCHQSW